MFSLSLVLNLASSLALMTVSFWLIRLKQEKKLWRELWQAAGVNTAKKWILDWPSVFLAKLCKLSAWKYEDQSRSKDQPCRIDLVVWSELARKLEVEAIIRRENGKQFDVYCKGALDSDAVEPLVARLNVSMSDGQVLPLNIRESEC